MPKHIHTSKPNSWFHIKFLCKFKPTYLEFLIGMAHYTDPETNAQKGYLNGKHIGYLNGLSPKWVNQNRG